MRGFARRPAAPSARSVRWSPPEPGDGRLAPMSRRRRRRRSTPTPAQIWRILNVLTLEAQRTRRAQAREHAEWKRRLAAEEAARKEAEAVWKRAEAARARAEAARAAEHREAEAARAAEHREAEAARKEEAAARKREAEARAAEHREAEAARAAEHREAEAARKEEAEARKREAAARKREAEARKREAEARAAEYREAEVAREAARREEEAARRLEAEALDREYRKAEEKRRREQAERDRAWERRFNKLSGDADNRWGRLAEGFVEEGLLQLLEARGLKIRWVAPAGVRGQFRGEEREFDLVAVGEHDTVVVEVKATLKSSDVTAFQKRIREFREFCPSLARDRIRGGLAYLTAGRRATLAGEAAGFYLIRAVDSKPRIVNSDDFRPSSF